MNKILGFMKKTTPLTSSIHFPDTPFFSAVMLAFNPFYSAEPRCCSERLLEGKKNLLQGPEAKPANLGNYGSFLSLK